MNFSIREGSITEAVAIAKQIPEFVNPHPIAEYEKRLNGVKHLILIAYVDERLIGFKVGYEREQDGSFYSWMGGVLSQIRRSGVAWQLAIAQEEWAKKNGYTKIVFKTRNRLKAMLLFALKNGFHIIAVEARETVEENRITLIKYLT